MGPKGGHLLDRVELAKQFDEAFYRSIAAAAEPFSDPQAHYLDVGWTLGFDPSPYFSTDSYLANNSDVRAAKVNPWRHFVEDGHKEGRSVSISRWVGSGHPADVFDCNWYKRTYPDVTGDPLEHYQMSGWHKGMWPSRYFDPEWYRSVHMGTDSDTPPLNHYLEQSRLADIQSHPIVDPEFLRAEYEIPLGTNVLTFLKSAPDDVRVSPWFDRETYLELNRDVASSGMAPEQHFSAHGIREGRIFAPGCHLRFRDRDRPDDGPEGNRFVQIVGTFPFDGKAADVIRRKVGGVIEAQIRAQASLDPDVVASGALALPYLPQFTATDIKARDLVDPSRLLQEFGGPYEAAIILPRLQIGGAEKYAANLAEAMRRIGVNDVVVVTTDSWSADDRAALQSGLLSGLRRARIASLFEHLKGSWRQDQLLAHLILCAGARYVFVINTEIGLKMISSFGAALSGETKLFAAFFSESPNAIGAPFSARFLRPVLPHATVLSDNMRSIRQWKARTGPVSEGAYECLPPAVEISGTNTFEAKVLARSNAGPQFPPRYLWMSRWESFKATDVLVALARRMPEAHIDAFGPIHGELPELPVNLHHRGPLHRFDSLNLENYQAFVFTSYFEGMPNVVLEMAANGIPIVAADVGGIGETFADHMVDTVSMLGTVEEISGRYAKTLRDLRKMGWGPLERRIREAREAVERRHSIEAFDRGLRHLMGINHA